MTFKSILSTLAGILCVIGYIPYIRAILKKETKPAKASWIIWAALNSITVAGMIEKHTVNDQILGATIGTWVVFLLALKYGKSGWRLLDKLCLGGAAFGIVLWWIFDNPVVGIITSLSVAFLGSFPTFKSAWNNPSQEDRAAWTIYGLSSVMAVLAIPAWTLADAAQPITFLMIETIMIYLLWLGPRQVKALEKAA
jgi:hypothetical protein